MIFIFRQGSSQDIKINDLNRWAKIDRGKGIRVVILWTEGNRSYVKSQEVLYRLANRVGVGEEQVSGTRDEPNG